ncbi:MAG: inositol monophosphatase [Planctomycetes bacterium]|nr:inositol monophosphatase [Planctomycetota bacterium]MCC7170239.1 inositol monophosphatase [Planctomycetota bacterium]
MSAVPDRATLARLALAAGERILAHEGRIRHEDAERKGVRDLVTAADLEAERVVTEGLARAYPDIALVAEEAVSRLGDRQAHARRILEQNELCFVLDPLDGTTNFAHGHPFYAVSLALVDRAGPRIGVVYAPRLGELFVAERGAGTTLNGRRVRVSRTTDLADCVFATGFPYRRNELSARENNVEHFHRFVMDVRDVRRCGSAAIDLAYVACGRYDVFFEAQLEAWDVAAGALLVREAGGVVTDYAGGDAWLTGRQMLATNGAVHEAARSRLQAP